MFTLGKFKPTETFVKIAELVEQEGLSTPAVAAGLMAYFMGGSHFDVFVECLVEDGLTKRGLAALAQACLKPFEED